MIKLHSYLVIPKKWAQFILDSLIRVRKSKKIYCILLMLSLMSTKVTAAIESPVNVSSATAPKINIMSSEQVTKFYYAVEPVKKPEQEESYLEEKSCIVEDQTKNIEYRNFFYLNTKCHVGMVLVTDLFSRGLGTVMDFSYYVLENNRENLITNNQSTKPTTDIKSAMCPPVCSTCYTILKILYPNLAQNKAIKYSEKGCQGAPATSFEDNILSYRLPVLANITKLHFERQNIDVNDLLLSIGLVTIEQNRKRLGFMLACHEGRSDEALAYLPDIRKIGLHYAEYINDLLLACCGAKGFLSIIQFLVEQEKANINYAFEKGEVTTVMTSLVSKHKDAWSYFSYFIRQQDIDCTQCLVEKDELFSIFDLVLDHLKAGVITQEDFIKTALFLLEKNRKKSVDAHQKCANELLLACCTVPDFLDFIKHLVENEGACVNYKGQGDLTIPMRTLQFAHAEALAYFKYMFNQGKIKIACNQKSLDSGRYITLLDLLFHYSGGENKQDVLSMAKSLITNVAPQGSSTIDEVQRLYASEALLACSCFPGFMDFIIFLVERLGADINHTDGIMSPYTRALRMQHHDAWNYLMYMYEKGDIDVYVSFHGKKKTTTFFDLLSICVAKNRVETKKVFLFLKNLYQQRKKQDNAVQLKSLLTNILAAFCGYPGFLGIINFCVKNGVNLHHKQKGAPFIPMKVFVSPDMILSEDQQSIKVYHPDAFKYLQCMLKYLKVDHNHGSQSASLNEFLRVIVLHATKGDHDPFMSLLQILHQRKLIINSNIRSLEKCKIFNSDHKWILKYMRNNKSPKINKIKSKVNKKKKPKKSKIKRQK